MNKLLIWLDEEAKGLKIFDVICKICLIAVVYNIAICIILIYTKGIIIPSIDDLIYLEKNITQIVLNLSMFMLANWFGMFWEETIFRLMPFWIAMRLFGKSYKIIIVAIVSSILFGYAHPIMFSMKGYAQALVTPHLHVLSQGVSGFLFSIVFLKCGGFNKNYIKALISSTTVHIFFNLFAILIILPINVFLFSFFRY